MRWQALCVALVTTACSGGDPGSGSSGGGTSGATDATTTGSVGTSTGTTDESTGSSGVSINECGCAEREVCVAHLSDCNACCGFTCEEIPTECGAVPTCDDLACVWELCDSLFCAGDGNYTCGLPVVETQAFGCVESALCTFWKQNCVSDEQCVPAGAEGSTFWDTTWCTEVSGTKQPGEACVVQDSPLSGKDDCDVGAVCWNVDPGTLEGTCVSLCEGPPYDPQCPTGTLCAMTKPYLLAVCLPPCDPFNDPCPGGHACTAIGDTFGCAPTAPTPVAFGEPCVHPNDCDLTLACVDGAMVHGCAGERCCTALCDLGAPVCPAGAQACGPFYEQAPDGLANVGLCGT